VPVSTAVPDPASVLVAYLREATEESRLAYEFSANSYTFSAMSACIAAEQALECFAGEIGECGQMLKILEASELPLEKKSASSASCTSTRSQT
jgi:hypothetical protein